MQRPSFAPNEVVMALSVKVLWPSSDCWSLCWAQGPPFVTIVDLPPLAVQA